jgi:hypothetical protein
MPDPILKNGSHPLPTGETVSRLTEFWDLVLSLKRDLMHGGCCELVFRMLPCRSIGSPTAADIYHRFLSLFPLGAIESNFEQFWLRRRANIPKTRR